jgi:hypothetical protein
MLATIEALTWNFGGFGKNNAALDPRLDFNFLLGLWLRPEILEGTNRGQQAGVGRQYAFLISMTLALLPLVEWGAVFAAVSQQRHRQRASRVCLAVSLQVQRVLLQSWAYQPTYPKY